MQQTGIVEECKNGFVKVKIVRGSACGDNCASCNLCPGRETVIEAKNECGANIGDNVILDMEGGRVINAAFLVYIVPVISLILGTLLGTKLSGSENIGILCGFSLLALSFLIIHFLDKSLKAKYSPSAVRIAAENE